MKRFFQCFKLGFQMAWKTLPFHTTILTLGGFLWMTLFMGGLAIHVENNLLVKTPQHLFFLFMTWSTLIVVPFSSILVTLENPQTLTIWKTQNFKITSTPSHTTLSQFWKTSFHIWKQHQQTLWKAAATTGIALILGTLLIDSVAVLFNASENTRTQIQVVSIMFLLTLSLFVFPIHILQKHTDTSQQLLKRNMSVDKVTQWLLFNTPLNPHVAESLKSILSTLAAIRKTWKDIMPFLFAMFLLVMSTTLLGIFLRLFVPTQPETLDLYEHQNGLFFIVEAISVFLVILYTTTWPQILSVQALHIITPPTSSEPTPPEASPGGTSHDSPKRDLER